MTKSVKYSLHVCFLVLIPLTISFYHWAGQADRFFGLENHASSFFQILSEDVQSVFVNPDKGSPIGSLSNVTMVFSNLIAYVLFPVTIFYLFHGYFSPKILAGRNMMSTVIPLLFILVVPFLLIKCLSIFTLVAWSFFYSLSLTYIITLFFAVSGFFFYVVDLWFHAEKLARQSLRRERIQLHSTDQP